jgi:hypothetical protein
MVTFKPNIMDRKLGNELIAQFMDLSRQDASNGGGYYLYEDPITGEYVNPENLPYMRDWNAIMPVVHEISNNVPLAMYEDYFDNNDTDFTLYVQPNIGQLWDLVAQFCRWYLEHRYDSKY